MKKLFYAVIAAVALAIVGLVALQPQNATAGDQRANFETNFTATIIGSNDTTSSAIFLDLASGNRWAKIVRCQAPPGGTVSWKLGPTLLTNEVANLEAEASNTVFTIDVGDGYNLAISARFNSVTNGVYTGSQTMKCKCIGFQ